MRSGLTRSGLLFVFLTCLSPAATAGPQLLKASAARPEPPADRLLQAEDQPLIGGSGEYTWTVPEAVEPGWHWIEFVGLSSAQPEEWRAEFEFEPYTVYVHAAGEEATEGEHAYSAEPDLEAAYEVGEPTGKLHLRRVVNQRRAGRPFLLQPGDEVTILVRGWSVLTGAPRLLPVPDASLADLQLRTDTRFHLFDDREPIRFDAEVARPVDGSFAGELVVEWLDALDGVVRRDEHAVEAAPGEAAKVAIEADLPLGAYTVRASLLRDGERLLTQERHLTRSVYVDAKSLPESWPFAWHLRPFDPMVPNVGFKWLRVFHDWRWMHTEKDHFTWKTMDRMVEMAREKGQYILYVNGGTPEWASTRPSADDAAAASGPVREGHLLKDPKKPFWGFPPKDWAELDLFTREMWKRDAPDGEVDVLRAMEILNEPNAGHSIAYDYDEYVEHAKTVYEATHELAEGAEVVGISQSGGLHMWFIEGVLDAGLGEYMDAASTHIYETSSPLGSVSVASKVDKLREAMAERGHPDIPIWNTETGIGCWGRYGSTITPASVMERRARESPQFDPSEPHKVGGSWRATNEWIASGYMVRSSAQQLVNGVKHVFYFKWQADKHSWVHDWADDGNVTPKMMLPVQSILSDLWGRYAGDAAVDLEIESPDDRFLVFAHRFDGPDGRMTVLYAHPKAGLWAMGDPLVGEDANQRGDQASNPEASQQLAAEVIDGDAFLTVRVPLDVLNEGDDAATVFDMLGRHRSEVAAEDDSLAIRIGITPQYVLSTNAPLPAWVATPDGAP